MGWSSSNSSLVHDIYYRRFFSLLFTSKTILEKQGDGSSFPHLMDLLFQHKIGMGNVHLHRLEPIFE